MSRKSGLADFFQKFGGEGVEGDGLGCRRRAKGRKAFFQDGDLSLFVG